MNRNLGCVCALLLTACGQPLVGETFTGTPVFSIRGAVVQANPRIPASHGDVSARLFWIGGEAQGVEQAVTLGAALAEFSMTLFEPPPPQAAAFDALVAEGDLGIGVIAVYADTDGDQVFDPTQDRLLGASAQHVVVHSSAGVAATDPAANLLGPLAPGYHLFEHDAESQCRFVDAASCPGEGGLVPAADLESVTLTLWGVPEDVRVPAPSLDPQGSIWVTP